MVPPAPLVPVVMTPPVPPAPDFPELPRSGGSSDEQLKAIARKDAHRETMPQHWRDRFVISSNLPFHRAHAILISCERFPTRTIGQGTIASVCRGILVLSVRRGIPAAWLPATFTESLPGP
jgi:hypothetical protein